MFDGKSIVFATGIALAVAVFGGMGGASRTPRPTKRRARRARPAAANMTGRNGYAVWESYVSGLDPAIG